MIQSSENDIARLRIGTSVWNLVKNTINLDSEYMSGNIFDRWVTISFSRRTLFRGVIL